MVRVNRLLTMLLLVALILSACQPITRPTASEAPPPHGLRFDAPPYAVDGPYAVGVRYFTIPAKAEHDRELLVSVWYPAQNPNRATTKIVYEQQFQRGETAPFSVIGHALLNAPPDSSGGPYPLVVYTHAHWSFAQELAYLTEHLASRGFVVISADHEDNWSTTFGPLVWQAMIRRAQEVTREIDFAESLSASGEKLAGMINTTAVGIAGWSLGGETGLEVAGARWDLSAARAWCAANPDGAKLNEWACTDILNHEADLAAFAGLPEAPKDLWPSRLDKRIRAVIPLAGPTIPFSSEGMQSIQVPVMFMVGSGETAVDPAFERAAPYESIRAEHKAKVVFDHAEHMVFGANCVDSPSLVALGFSMFCSDPVWDMARAHDLVNHFATAFLLAELKGDGEAAQALAPENVSFSGIQYQSSGYGAQAEAKAELSVGTLDEPTVATIEGIVKEWMQASEVPGYAMCVAKDGQVVYRKGFGVLEKGTERAVTPQSIFGQRSIAKSLTAIAVMQLVEQGKVDLDAPVTTYLPYFTMADPRYEEMTVRMLLNHTAGLTDDFRNEAVAKAAEEPVDYGAAMEWYVRTLNNDTLIAAPGSSYNYADLDYTLLADIIGKASGLPYDAYMKKFIFEPLKMTSAVWNRADVLSEQLAREHVTGADGAPVVNEPFFFLRSEAPAALLYANCDDMLRFIMMSLNRGELDGVRILQPESFDALWHGAITTGWYDTLGAHFGPAYEQYGLGWFTGEAAGHRVVGHAGGGNGYNAQIELAPNDNVGIVIMSNWLVDPPPTGLYPACLAAVDVLYTLLGINPQ